MSTTIEVRFPLEVEAGLVPVHIEEAVEREFLRVARTVAAQIVNERYDRQAFAEATAQFIISEGKGFVFQPRLVDFPREAA